MTVPNWLAIGLIVNVVVTVGIVVMVGIALLRMTSFMRDCLYSEIQQHRRSLERAAINLSRLDRAIRAGKAGEFHFSPSRFKTYYRLLPHLHMLNSREAY